MVKQVLNKLVNSFTGFIVIALPALTAIFIGVWAGHQLAEQKQLTHGASLIAEISFGLIVFIVFEWILFRVEKNEFQTEIKNSLVELKESRSQTEKLLNEFAESNHLVEKLANSLREDLRFDHHVKLNAEHKPFHLFIASLKYEYFLSSYFKYDLHPDKPAITKIPRYYFEEYTKSTGEKHSIWMWLIDKSSSYKSIQVLNRETSDIYLTNSERLEVETNYLKTQYENRKAKLRSIRKLFVIKDEWVSLDGKTIVDENVIKYLQVWKNKLAGMSHASKKNLHVKFIKLSSAKGCLNNNAHIEDIGVFDNILGIQTPTDTEAKLINDGTKINFYFDREFVEDYQEKFETIFKNSNNLI